MKSLPAILGLVGVAVCCSLAIPQEVAPPQLEGSFATSAVRRYTPGKWGTVNLVLTNPTDRPISGTADIATADDLQLQFARRFWIPPRSQRQVWIPLKIPAEFPREVGHVDLRGRILIDTPGGSQLARTAGEQMHQSPLALIDHEQIKTALLLPRSRLTMTRKQEFRADKAQEIVVKSRMAFGLSGTTITIHDDFLPPEAFMLEGADQVVLATDAIVEDSVGLRTLRRWVTGGGRLWIMLDMVSRDTVKELLGGGFDLEYVDRVELDRVEWRYDPPLAGSQTSLAKEFDYAVEMVRVSTDIPQVIQRVDGWPASMLMPYGDGAVLFTTLEARAWLELSNGSIVPELDYLTGQILKPRTHTRVSVADLRPGLEELIGYQIPRRRTVLALLGGACLAMFAAAGVFWGWGRLEWFAVAGPSVALATAVLFFLMGAANKQQVMSAMVGVQVASYAPEAREASIGGAAAIYIPDTGAVPLRGDRGGLIWPRLNGLEGTNKRLLWLDQEQWLWEELRLPAGIRPAQLEAQVAVTNPVAVSGRFGPRGFAGRLSAGDLREVGDAIIATPGSRRLGVTLEADGGFVVNSGNTLARDQFTLEALLSDEQRRRRDVYRAFVTPRNEFPYPLRPTFLCWGQPLELGMRVPESLEQRGSLLVSIPLLIEPTPPGTSFFVPSAFSRVSLMVDVEGQSAAFNPRLGEWTPDLTSVTRTRPHFALPPQVLPAVLERGEISIKVNAPSRDVQIVLRRGDQDLPLRTLRDANGVYTIPIDKADQLWVDERGGIGTGVFVSPQRDADTTGSGGKTPDGNARPIGWTIDYFRLDLWGRTTGPQDGASARPASPANPPAKRE